MGSAGISALEAMTSTSITVLKSPKENDGVLELQARGHPEDVARLRVVLDERVEACSDFVDEEVVIPGHLMGRIMGNEGIINKIEITSDSISRVRSGGNKGEKVIEFTGT